MNRYETALRDLAWTRRIRVHMHPCMKLLKCLWRHTDVFLEDSTKVARIGVAALARDLVDILIVSFIKEKSPRIPDSIMVDSLDDGLVKRSLVYPLQVIRVDFNCLADRGSGQAFMEVGFNVLSCLFRDCC